MDDQHIYINPDGTWWDSFEYSKHHRSEYPNAVEFVFPKQETWEANEAYLSAMASILCLNLSN